MKLDADIAIIGAGFGGSLTALLCQRIGLAPVLIERDRHPRFAIGESSTPMADLILEGLARTYGLPRLEPLAHYGSWRRTYPQVTCGRKRGFSYFHHRAGEPFAARPDRANELLVAASPDDESSDTHWFRADVDRFFADEVVAAGIPYFDRTRITNFTHGDRWSIDAISDDRAIEIATPFVVDASGTGGVLRRALGIDDTPSNLHTDSCTVYGHFTDVEPWAQVYRSSAAMPTDTSHHPFCCDAAALHHVFDGGWMWVLRFDNGVTSAGFVLDRQRGSLAESVEGLTPGDTWSSLLRRFPSIARQFEKALVVEPIRKTGRLQRLVAQAAGADWAMLPHTACFVDPLHSAGNAHTLLGIERLIRIFEDARRSTPAADRLADYDAALRRDAGLLDLVIHGCYTSFRSFDWMSAYSMFYFAGATLSEHRRRTGTARPEDGFLCGHDAAFVDVARTAHNIVCNAARVGHMTEENACAFQAEVRAMLEPFNVAGLCDPAKGNMYPFP